MAKPETITIHQLGRLGVDENNKLYWDDRPLVTENIITLDRWVNVSIIVGASSTMVMAVIAAWDFFVPYSMIWGRQW